METLGWTQLGISYFFRLVIDTVLPSAETFQKNLIMFPFTKLALPAGYFEFFLYLLPLPSFFRIKNREQKMGETKVNKIYFF